MKRLTLLSLAVVCAFAQTARFPGTVVTDSDLGVASNSISTKLTASLTSGATTMTVASSAGIAVNQILTIADKVLEFVWVCQVSGATITLGKSSCPNADGRGVDGSTAAAHGNNTVVEGRINAWYHNSVKEEIKAIESSVQKNVYFAKDFNLAAQTPGGSLFAGGLNQPITLTPCPPGLAGSDTGHWVYISGGTGTAEAVLITGGTCTSGAATGTITVTPANNHSGAWQVMSATAGGQEAHNVATDGSTIQFPGGTNNFYGPMSISKAVTIAGGGVSDLPNITQNNPAASVFVNTVSGSGATIRDLLIDYSTQGQSGTSCIVMQGSASGGIFHPQIFNVQCIKAYNGAMINDAQLALVDHLVVQQFTNAGLFFDQNFGYSAGGGDSFVRNSVFLGGPGSGIYGIYVRKNSILFVHNCKFNGGDYGFYWTNPASYNTGGLYFTGNSVENNNLAGVVVATAASGNIVDVRIQDNTIDQSAYDVQWDGIILAPGGSGNLNAIQIQNNRIAGLPGRSQLQIGVLFGGSGTADVIQLSDQLFDTLDNAAVVSTGTGHLSITGSRYRNVTTPFNISNTQTLVSGMAQQCTFSEMSGWGAVQDGSVALCSNCNSTCANGSGNGRTCFRENGAWTH